MTNGNPFPNLFLIGAPKAGTTFLHAHIITSPDVFDSGYKEPNFFHFDGFKFAQSGADKIPVLPEQYSAEKYLELYKGWKTEPYAIDATTKYLHGWNSAKNIHNRRPDAKIVAAVRDPIDRAYSHYLMNVRDGWVTDPIMDAIEFGEAAESDAKYPSAFHFGFVRQSIYLDAIQEYVDVFGAENVRVYLFSDITKNLPKVLEDLSDFLEIEIAAAPVSDDAQNTFKVERSPHLSKLLKKYHSSTFKFIVNAVVPRGIRDRVRNSLFRFRNKDGVKPQLDPDARRKLEERFGTDFEDTIAYGKKNKILFQPKPESNDE